jgi:hypothetical protein
MNNAKECGRFRQCVAQRRQPHRRVPRQGRRRPFSGFYHCGCWLTSSLLPASARGVRPRRCDRAASLAHQAIGAPSRRCLHPRGARPESCCWSSPHSSSSAGRCSRVAWRPRHVRTHPARDQRRQAGNQFSAAGIQVWKIKTRLGFAVGGPHRGGQGRHRGGRGRSRRRSGCPVPIRAEGSRARLLRPTESTVVGLPGSGRWTRPVACAAGEGVLHCD